MAVGFSNTNKPLNPRGNDASPKGYNRAALYSGKALDFDGVNDKVTSSAFSLDTSSFSISMILKSDSVVSDEIFFAFAETGANNESFIFYKDSTNSNKIAFYGAPFTGSPVLLNYVIPTDYEHLTFTFASNTLSLYVNGVFVDSGSVTGNDGTQTASAMIGVRKLASYSQYFNGQITNTKIFNEVLTAAQVADLYNNPEKVVPTGVDNTALKLWLPMQEGAGTTAYDGSGNGNHGTISGATYVNGVGAPVAQTAVIDWNKGTNLFPYSEDLSDSQWFKPAGITYAVDQTTAPDGRTTADKIIESTTTAEHMVYGSHTTSAYTDYTASVYIKDNTRGFCFVQIAPNAADTTKRYTIVVDLSNGSVTDTAGNSTDASYDISDAGNGWYRISVTRPHTAASSIFIVYGLSDSGTPTYDAQFEPTYTGDGTSSLYVWGASLTASSAVTPYIPTFATAQTSPVLLPQGLTSGRDITGVNLFENVRKQGALNLDGNSWAEVHDNASLDLTTDISVEAWVYWDGISSSYGILGKYNTTADKREFLLFKSTTTKATFNISGNGTGTSAGVNSIDLTANQWYHLVGTYDGSNVRIYTNGVESNSSASAVTLFSSDTNLDIGRFNNDNEYPDQIAQPRIYNRALTAAEVLQNYNSGKNTYK